jgi:hypothetical protein
MEVHGRYINIVEAIWEFQSKKSTAQVNRNIKVWIEMMKEFSKSF